MTALTNIIRSGSLTPQITALDGADWSDGAVPETLADPMFDSPEIRSVISAAQGTVKSYSVGVFSDRLPGGAVGVPGFARSVPEGSPRRRRCPSTSSSTSSRPNRERTSSSGSGSRRHKTSTCPSTACT
ncbi:hypothetical protein NKG05_27195 [Oerskovia sp. M15]